MSIARLGAIIDMLVSEGAVETIGQRIQRIRERHLLTQQDLANATGLGIATISRLENDQHIRRPHPSTVRRIGEALGVNPLYLLTGEVEAQESAHQ